MSTVQGFALIPTEPMIRAFEKYAHEREFNDFIDALQNRAVQVLIQSAGQRDEVVNRWQAGRAQELLELVGAFKERVLLRETEEYTGRVDNEDPLRGVDL